MLLDVIESGHSPRSPQSLISYDYIKRMGTDLVHLCDGIEKYGLVDYQYGVWEDPITNSEFTPSGPLSREYQD